jgi:glutaminyl-tRNA synthetase
VITNYPEDKEEWMETVNNPEDAAMGTRTIPFSREVYIEREDFMEDPPRKFFRLGPGREVRLKSAYIISCEDVVKDENGQITEIRCSYDKATRSGGPEANRKVKGTLHWVSARHAVEAEVRLYDRLFSDPDPAGHKDQSPADFLNPESLKVIAGMVEPSLKEARPLDHFRLRGRVARIAQPRLRLGDGVVHDVALLGAKPRGMERIVRKRLVNLVLQEQVMLHKHVAQAMVDLRGRPDA